MLSCHELKKGDIYICEECGLQLQVIKECKDSSKSVDNLDCCTSEENCSFSCCGQVLTKKR